MKQLFKPKLKIISNRVFHHVEKYNENEAKKMKIPVQIPNRKWKNMLMA